MVKEKYWAVRIGTPGKHTPYLMVNADSPSSPALFTGQLDAEHAALLRISKRIDCKIVQVEVRELRTRNKK